MIEAIVLGAGAGGGFPQWNSNTVACRRARAGDPAAPSCTQASIAVSGNGTGWLVLNASPDLRIQIERTPALHPRDGLRSTPIAGVVLTGGEVDCIAGLLTLREGQHFQLLATAPVLARLDQNPIFEVVSRTLVPRVALPLEASMLLSGTALSVTAFAVRGKVPLYAESGSPDGPPPSDDDTIGLEISDGTRRLLFIPGCAAMTPALRARLDGADCVFFDATLWRDDEMITAGLGVKTGARMGHMSIAGPGGVLDSFDGVRVGQKILIHMNNSNPVLLRDSVERADAAQAGWDVAQDGMTVRL
jgi:pyrroloquinoline quinone biosynthesis protein B